MSSRVEELEAIGARLTQSILDSYKRSAQLNYRSYTRETPG